MPGEDKIQPREAVIQEIRYWQQSSADGHTNPKKAQKMASFAYWQQICRVCSQPIPALDSATFHHLKRGIAGLHSPENMVPVHRDGGCHELLHDAPPGSFTAGSLRAKKPSGS